MSLLEQEILSTPAVLRATLARVKEGRGVLAPLLRRPAAFLGCGSSYCIGLSAAALYETGLRLPAQGIMASDYLPRPDWAHLAISRTGRTTELVDAMGRARGAGAPVALICGESGTPAEAEAHATLLLDFASEESIIQTRFIAAATLSLRLLLGGQAEEGMLAGLPDRMEAALETFDPAPLSRFNHVVYLGRGWRYGLALAASLNLQETALFGAGGFQTLDYRHGPLAGADSGTLVWCFDPVDDPLSGAVLAEIRRTGATVRCMNDDPLIALAQAQLVALRYAAARGIDPATPRNLSRAVVLAGANG